VKEVLFDMLYKKVVEFKVLGTDTKWEGACTVN